VAEGLFRHHIYATLQRILQILLEGSDIQKVPAGLEINKNIQITALGHLHRVR